MDGINKEVAINYGYTENVWNENKMRNIDDIFSYAVTCDAFGNDDPEPTSVIECQNRQDWVKWKDIIQPKELNMEIKYGSNSPCAAHMRRNGKVKSIIPRKKDAPSQSRSHGRHNQQPDGFPAGSPLIFDPEIEKTAKKLRKQAKLRKKQGESTSSPVLNIWKDIDLSSDSESNTEEPHLEEEEKPLTEEEELVTETKGEEEEEMAAPPPERTLRQWAAPNVDDAPLYITYPTDEVGTELKTGLIHLLPRFHGLASEDPYKHITEFHMVCLGMKPQARSWSFYLPPGSITTWAQMARAFLEKFFAASKAVGLRRKICGINQMDLESLYEYWERFQRLCVSFPQHGISDELLFQYFYEGLLPMERKMMDTASEGAIVNKTPTQARALIDTMAENSKQFGVRSDVAMKDVQQVKACGVCSTVGHPTDACPTLQEPPEQVNAMGGKIINSSKHHPVFSNNTIQEHRFSWVVNNNIKHLKLLVAQIETNPKAQLNAITLQSDMEVRGNESEKDESQKKKELKATIAKPSGGKIPKYAKFLKEWCTHKWKSKGKEKMDMIENVSAVFQKNLPPKCSDPSMFTIPCMVGNVTVDTAMLDLGASINENNTSKSNMMLLGRPFLKTSRTKIDVYDGTLSMEFGNKLIKFNIHDTMRYSGVVHSLCFVNAYTPLTDNVSALTNDFVLKENFSGNEKVESVEKITKDLGLNDDTSERIAWMEMGPQRYDDLHHQMPCTNKNSLLTFLQVLDVGSRPLPDLLCHEYWSSEDAMKIDEVPLGWRGAGLTKKVPWLCWDVG
ncbi:hypothetical protein OSB04_019410 [Centaurea solstitialis]|uniref:Retrotransposon gag domain-containing protein n=1 Tax=Centaurea solstitialis TaxID=347529 RepID=A0AA38T8S1_9ASTR|nr:hypothetical protein OSB04_019410 [Centaurea solstitialis]